MYLHKCEVQLKPDLDFFGGVGGRCVTNPDGTALPCSKFNPFTFIGSLCASYFCFLVVDSVAHQAMQ